MKTKFLIIALTNVMLAIGYNAGAQYSAPLAAGNNDPIAAKTAPVQTAPEKHWLNHSPCFLATNEYPDLHSRMALRFTQFLEWKKLQDESEAQYSPESRVKASPQSSPLIY